MDPLIVTTFARGFSDKLAEGLSGKLAESWVATIVAPAIVFWAGGLLAVLSCSDFSLWSLWWSCDSRSWQRLGDWFIGLPQPTLIPLLIVGLVFLAASGTIAQLFSRQILRLAEGYWPNWLNPVRIRLIQRTLDRSETDSQTWDRLAQKRISGESPTADERLAYMVADRRLSFVPNEYVERNGRLVRVPRADRFMPTEFGNILRAAELRPDAKYGLDQIVCWPRLWLLLPDGAKSDVTQARSQLDTAAVLCSWSVLFHIWALFAWWALPVAQIATYLTYQTMLSAAIAYGDLVDATFDVHRATLYEALHWPLPRNPVEEREIGKQLTQYLWHSYRRSEPSFTNTSSPTTSADAATTDHRTIIYRFFDEVVSGVNGREADEIIAHDCIIHRSDSSEIGVGVETIRQFARAYHGTRMVVEDLITQDDRAVARWTLRTIHPDGLVGNSSPKQQPTSSGIGIFRFARGQIKEIWLSSTVGLPQESPTTKGPERRLMVVRRRSSGSRR